MNAGPAIGIREAVSVAHETIGPRHLTTGIDGRNCMLRCQRDDSFAAIQKEWITPDEERANSILHHCRERGVDLARA